MKDKGGEEIRRDLQKITRRRKETGGGQERDEKGGDREDPEGGGRKGEQGHRIGTNKRKHWGTLLRLPTAK